jgi:hypothetical protein
MEIKLEKFEELRAAPKRNGKYEPAPRVRSPFSPETFDLLAGLHDDPTKTYYQEHREGIRDHVEEPFRRLVRNVAKRVRAPITGLMETEKDVFARILKHDRGWGGAWPHPRGTRGGDGRGARRHDRQRRSRLLWQLRLPCAGPILMTGALIDQNAEDLSNRHRTSHNAAAKINGHPADVPLVRGG